MGALLPEVGLVYKLKNVNHWVKIIQVDTQNEQGVWYAEVWMDTHAGVWSGQAWVAVEDINLKRKRKQ